MLKTNLWVFDSNKGVFLKAEVLGKPVQMKKSGDYKWLIFPNPFPTPGREYIMAEKGTGYVLAYGRDGTEAYENGLKRFCSENLGGIKVTDIRQLINYQMLLLKRSIPEPDYNEIRPDLSGFKSTIITYKPQRLYAKSK